MRHERAEIEAVLASGKRILSEHPELINMSLDEVLDELDDGTQQMIHDRWGVTANMIVTSIKNWEPKALVEHLAQVESGELTFEYAGYLLQNEYGIDLEALLLESSNLGCYDKIVKYVYTNLRFIPEVRNQNILPILNVLEMHSDHTSYSSCLSNYATGIASCDGFRQIEEVLGDLQISTHYRLLGFLRRHWYGKNAPEATETISHLLKYKTIWSKKAAIDYWEMAIEYDITVFERYFKQMECLLNESKELWIQLVPVFTKYLLTAAKDETQSLSYLQAKEYLERIPGDALDVKCSFLQSIQFAKDIAGDVYKIYRAILSSSFEQNQDPLDLLDYHWYLQIENGNYLNTIKDMEITFCANKYRTKYSKFFGALNSTLHELSTHASTVTEIALEYMLLDNVDQLFFGLGLLMDVGSINKFYTQKQSENPPFTGLYTDEQLIQIIKPVLYFSANDTKTCHIAFQLLSLSAGLHDKYIAFCMDEVFGDYPETLHEVSAHYSESATSSQANLFNRVTEAYDAAVAEHRQACEIMDLKPSLEHQAIYRKAKYEHSKQIRKRANEQAFYTRFFKSSSLKYGVRYGFIVRGTKNQKFYQVSPFQHFSTKMELATSYVTDPVDYEMRRRNYLSEVIPDETDN